jgi:hypothetical protein
LIDQTTAQKGFKLKKEPLTGRLPSLETRFRKHEHLSSPKRQALSTNTTESVPAEAYWSFCSCLHSNLFTIFKYFYKLAPEPYH